MGFFQIFRSNGKNKLAQFMNVPGDDGKTYGEIKLSIGSRQNQAEHGECVLEIRNGERTLCLVHFSSSNQTWVFSLQNLNPVWLARFS